MEKIVSLPVMLLLAALTGSAVSQPANVGWPEAVARLAEARSKAQTCAALLMGHGNEAQISSGRLAYGAAKAEIDAVIAGLIVALAEGGKPDSLATLQTRLEQGTSDLAKFCGTVSDLVPATPGQRNVIADITKAAIEQLVKPLSEAIATLYKHHREDEALTRLTIQTQLEAAKWPDFASVKAEQ